MHALGALEGDIPSKQHRVAVLRRLYSWLVETGRIGRHEDPMFRRVKVPQSKPKETPLPPWEDFFKVRDALTDPWRALFIVQGATGMHSTELYQLATVGRILPPGSREDGADAILEIPRHKSGVPYSVAVTQVVKEAAERVQKRGAFGLKNFARAVRAASRSVGVRPMTSRIMRHLVATYAVSRGVSILAAGEFLGHKSPRQTRTYAQNAPRMVLTLADEG